jgi:hypothetical protein
MDPDPDNNRSHHLYVGEIGGSTGGLVTRNIFYHAIAGQGLKLAAASKTNGPSGVTVSYNTIYDSSEHGISVGYESTANVLDRNLIVINGNDDGAVRAQDLYAGAETNVIRDQGHWQAGPVAIRYYPDNGIRFVDEGGHLSEDPMWQDGKVDGCTAEHFVPTNPAMERYGRWAP